MILLILLIGFCSSQGKIKCQKIATRKIFTRGGTAGDFYADGTSECKFPFSYNNVCYNSCISDDNDNKPWCYTKMGPNLWGNCIQTSPVTPAPITPVTLAPSPVTLYTLLGDGYCVGGSRASVNRIYSNQKRLDVSVCKTMCNSLSSCAGYTLNHAGVCLVYGSMTVAPSDNWTYAFYSAKTITGTSNGPYDSGISCYVKEDTKAPSSASPTAAMCMKKICDGCKFSGTGTRKSDRSIKDCKRACMNDPTCIGIDVGFSNQRCYFVDQVAETRTDASYQAWYRDTDCTVRCEWPYGMLIAKLQSASTYCNENTNAVNHEFTGTLEECAALVFQHCPWKQKFNYLEAYEKSGSMCQCTNECPEELQRSANHGAKIYTLYCQYNSS